MIPAGIRVNARLWVEDGGLLLVACLPERGYAFLPGGGVEPGEPAAAAAAAAAHELEETGIARGRVRVRHPLGVAEQSRLDGDRGAVHAVEVVLAAEVEDLCGGGTVSSREPHLAFGWLPLAELPLAAFEPRALRVLLPAWRESAPGAFASDMQAPRGR